MRVVKFLKAYLTLGVCGFFFCTETEGFKIDTMGTYHGLSLESVKVISGTKEMLHAPFLG